MKGWNEPSKYGKANVLGAGLCNKAGEVSSRAREEREFGHVLDHCVARHIRDLINTAAGIRGIFKNVFTE